MQVTILGIFEMNITPDSYVGNFRGFDFANHFVEYTIDYGYDQPPYYEINCDHFPAIAHQELFFESYLRELKYPERGMRNEIARMIVETNAFVPVSHLFWGVWGLLQVEVSPVGFGFAVSFHSFVYVILSLLGIWTRSTSALF